MHKRPNVQNRLGRKYIVETMAEDGCWGRGTGYESVGRLWAEARQRRMLSRVHRSEAREWERSLT